MTRLAGRRVLVTGAASGIGRATAERFVREGARVFLTDRDRDRLAEVAKAFAMPHMSGDVTDESQVAVVVGAAVAALGGLDGVVNSAGADLLSPIGEMDRAAWDRIIAVNLSAPYLVCRAARAALVAAGKATVVIIASGAALRPLENRTAYCAAKAGAVMFGKSLAIELAPHGVRVNSICPGIIDTPMFQASWENAADPKAEFARIMERYVIKRVGRPEEIAEAALYLTSDESSFVTGTTLAVDGGRTFH
jgi:NAD(P)-dependent dehydrogenase (short-subunit alcohol dehydrogenase family)